MTSAAPCAFAVKEKRNSGKIHAGGPFVMVQVGPQEKLFDPYLSTELGWAEWEKKGSQS